MGTKGHSQRTMLPLAALIVSFWSVGHVASQALDVCPANSPAKALPFLKGAKPAAIATVLGTGSSITINMSAVTDFIKTTLVPMIGANMFFFALAALFLLIFILWRFLRFCCYIICCRGSCDAKRDKNNIYQLLFSKRMKILKGFMFLFGLIAIIFAIYGMASASKQKDMVGPAFGVIDTLSTYFGQVSGEVNNLVATISNVTGIIDDFQAIVTVDINVDNLTATLTAIGTFLDSLPNPPGVLTSINALKARFDTFKGASGALQNYVNGVATFNTEHTNLNTNLDTLISAQADLTDMQTKCGAVVTELTNVGAGAWGTATHPAAGALSALNTALGNMVTATWVTKLDTLSAAIDSVAALQTPTTDPFSKLWTLADLVQKEVTGMSTDIDNLVTAINGLATKNTAIMPTLDFLSQKLVYINTTVLQLTSGMQSAYNSLQSANTSASAVFAGSPSPVDQAVTDLGTLKSQLPSITAMTNVKSLLNTPKSTLESSTSAPFTVNGPIYKNWISLLKASFNDANVGAFKSAVTTYVGAETDGNWNPALYSSATGNKYSPFNTLMGAITGTSQLGGTMLSDATQLVQKFGSAASTIKTQGNDATLNTAISTASAAATAARSAAPVTMTLPGVATQLTAVKTIYDGFGTPYSTVVNGPKAELANIKSSAITTGNSAKQQIQDGIAGVNSTVGNMQSMLVGQLSNVKAKYEPAAHQYDGYRYSASMALYGVSILFVGLLLMSGYLNYHFGANFSVFSLLIITILYFLLAVLIALLISVLYLGCGDLEPLIMQFAPALAPTLTPVLKYYFLNEGTDLKSVLKEANMVDVDAMITQIKDSQGDILAGLAGSFTFKAAPLAVLARINGTITGVETGVDALLTTLGRDGLLPVYGEVKGLVCCTIPDMMSSMWIGLTFAGIFAFALIFCTFFFIGKLDKTPRKDCCGCTCHTQGKYAGTVFPDTLPQFQAPGFDNPLGPYDAPNGAMWNGGGEGMVVVNASNPGHKGR